VVRLAEKYLGHIPAFNAPPHRVPFGQYRPRVEVVKRHITQAHCAIGRNAYALQEANRLPFFMLVNILGGPGMNSRLNLALREKHGYVYSIDAGYHPYTDTGLFGIFFGTDPGQLEKSRKLVHKELRLLKEVPLGTKQLHVAKEQLMGQLAMAEENNMSLMLMMAKSLLDLGKIEPLDHIFQQIRSVTSRQLQDIAQEMFDENNLSELTFIPID
jgi:predicted Zn-dependent peptidase